MTVNYSNIRRQVQRQSMRRKPPLSKRTAESFNYAACMLPVLYNLIYQRYSIAVTCLILTAIPHCLDVFLPSLPYSILIVLITFITLIVAYYSGKTGNVSAYKARNYEDEEDFLVSQKWWVVGAAVALIIHLLVFPMQIRGHFNTAKMISLSNAKEELKQALILGANNNEILGVNVFGENIPEFFAKYIKGASFDPENATIDSLKGYTYKIEGYDAECGQRDANTFHGDKTACAKVYVDVNGKNPPNLSASSENGDGVKELFKNSKKLNDIFALYVYSDDLAPKEGSIEAYAFKKFERK